jgi:hypothetical protein
MTFVPQVAKVYNPAKEYMTGFWLSSQKLNGVRSIYLRNATERGLRSQNLKTRYVGFDRLELACKAICDQHNLSFLDGDLYIPGASLETTSLLVRDRSNYDISEKLGVEFKVSAIGLVANPNLTGNEMVSMIQQIFPAQGMLSYVPQKLIRNTPLAVLDESNAINGGMNQGLILRNPDFAYSETPSETLLRVNGITSGIFTVVGFTQNPVVDYVSYMSVEGIVNGVSKVSRVYGLNDEEAQELWMNRDSYIGKQVQIVYMGLSPTGNLRNAALGRFV